MRYCGSTRIGCLRSAAGLLRLRSLAASAIGLLGLTFFYGLGTAVPASVMVSFTAWVVLYFVCVLALFAAIFYAANGALEALHGPHRTGRNVDC